MFNIILSDKTFYLAIVLLIIGEGLKGLEFIKKNMIIWILMIISICINFIFRGIGVNALFEAIISVSLSTFLYDIIKNIKKILRAYDWQNALFLRKYIRGERSMMFEEISLTPQEILDKDFKLDTRGYRPQEVDKFLDVIISDYTKFISIVKREESEKKELIEENLRLKQELRENKEKMELLKNTSSKELTNVDMLRRLSILEKVVFGDKNNY